MRASLTTIPEVELWAVVDCTVGPVVSVVSAFAVSAGNEVVVARPVGFGRDAVGVTVCRKGIVEVFLFGGGSK